MTLEIAKKLKRAFIFFVIGSLAIIAIFAFIVLTHFFEKKEQLGYPSRALSIMNRPLSSESFSGVTSPDTRQTENFDTVNSSAVTPSSTDSIIVDRKLTQDGNVSLIVSRIETSVDVLTDLATRLGGRVDSVDFQNNENNEQKTALVVIRVPEANFVNAMKEVKTIGLKVVSESVATRDVTEQFVDMQARLKTFKSTEEQYLGIMKDAKNVDEVLKVSQYLSDIRVQIEQIQGQMNYLSRQIDMSVITVALSSEPDVDTNVIWNPGTVAKNAVTDFIKAFYVFINAIIRLVLFYLPFFIILSSFAFLIFIFYMKVLLPWYKGGRDIFRF